MGRSHNGPRESSMIPSPDVYVTVVYTDEYQRVQPTLVDGANSFDQSSEC